MLYLHVLETANTEKMNSEQRCAVKAQIDVYLQKFPNASTVDIKKWILSGQQVPGVDEMKKKIFQ